MWMEWRACFKHGYGSPVWREVQTAEEAAEEAIELDHEEGDPDGFRQGKYTLHEQAPIKVIEEKLSIANEYVVYYSKLKAQYEAELASRKNRV